MCFAGRPLSTSLQAKPRPVEEVQKTSLYDLHVNQKGKMVNFAGFYLPIQYEDASISASHSHTRSNYSIFDVSHMLQTYVRGKHAVQFMESLCVTDVASKFGFLKIFDDGEKIFRVVFQFN